MKCRMIPSNGAYRIVTPYMHSFVAELKATVPASERSYDPVTKCWTVSANNGQTVGALIAKCFGQWVDVPAIQNVSSLGIIEVLYLGSTKDRGAGEKTAFGWTQTEGQLAGGWNVIFPEKVLKAYFDPTTTEKPAERPSTKTYYETLGIRIGADADQIKAGYRRMVKQWHPDVCKDPDAHEIFIGIQKAYEVLNNPKMKARYDVGLKMSAGLNAPKPKRAWEQREEQLPYRAPLKCGNLLCEYTALGIKKTVSKILQWEDIYNNLGQVLVSSWAMGDSEPTLEWR